MAVMLRLRRHYVSDTVSEHKLFLVQSFCFRKKNVICTNLFKDLISDHVGVIPQMLQNHDGQRHDQMQNPVSNIPCISGTVSATTWQNLKI